MDRRARRKKSPHWPSPFFCPLLGDELIVLGLCCLLSLETFNFESPSDTFRSKELPDWGSHIYEVESPLEQKAP